MTERGIDAAGGKTPRSNRYCKWCGTDIDPEKYDYGGPEYCTSQHTNQASRMRNKRRKKPPKKCPTPKKMMLYERGDAIVQASLHGQWAYPCVCNFYHLTSTKPRREYTELSALIEKKTADREKLRVIRNAAAAAAAAAATAATATSADVETRADTEARAVSIQKKIDDLWCAVHEIADAIQATNSKINQFTSSKNRDTITTNDDATQTEETEDDHVLRSSADSGAAPPRRSALRRWIRRS